MSAGGVILGIVGGGIGGTALSGALAYVKGWLDFKGKREERRDARFDKLFDEARGHARSTEPLSRAEGIFMLRKLAVQTQFTADQARLAGEMADFYAAQALAHARELQQRGSSWGFRLRRGQ